MGRLLSDRRLVAAAGISLLLHLGAAGLLWVVGPGLFSYDSGNHDTTMTVYALGTGAGTELDAIGDTEGDDASDRRAESAGRDDSELEFEDGESEGEQPELEKALAPDQTEVAEAAGLAEAEERVRDDLARDSDAEEPLRRENMELDSSERGTQVSAPTSVRRADETGEPSPELRGPADRRAERTGAEQTGVERTGASRDELLEQLYRELEDTFEYPRVARSRAIEGTVVLSVWVGLDGELKELTVEEASGSRVLDEAATETVAKLFPRTQTQQDAHRVRLQVRYALN